MSETGEDICGGGINRRNVPCQFKRRVEILESIFGLYTLLSLFLDITI